MTGYVADISWKSGERAIEKLDRLRSTMAVNVLRRTGRDMMKSVYRFSCQAPVVLVRL